MNLDELTDAAIDGMESRHMDATIAEHIMGYDATLPPYEPTDPHWYAGMHQPEPRDIGDGTLVPVIDNESVIELPYYSASPTRAHDVEARLAEMGLDVQYVVRLREVLDPKCGLPLMFEMVHASPRDRCRAALRAVRDAKGAGDEHHS